MVSTRLPLLCIFAAVLCSCDVDLFGWKKVAGGYYLHEWGEGDPGYILFPPDGGSPKSPEIKVQELGWKKPFIIVRPVKTTDHWIVIDTRTNERTVISDEQRTIDQNYRRIAVYSAADAWHRLRRTNQW